MSDIQLTPIRVQRCFQSDTFNGKQGSGESFEFALGLQRVLPRNIFLDVLDFFEQLFLFAFIHFKAMIPTDLTLLQIGCVVASVIFRTADCHLKQRVAGMVKEITIMRNDDRRAFPLCEVTFKPFDSFDVKMIGRLIEQQQIGIGQQQTSQMRTCALSAR